MESSKTIFTLKDRKIEQLKHCPFCGGEADLHHGNDYYWVRCKSRLCGVSGHVSDSEEEAVEAWNTRVERTCYRVLYNVKAEPFTWDDNFSQLAIEDFECIQGNLPYCIAQSIGMALAKLKLLEDQGAKVVEQ